MKKARTRWMGCGVVIAALCGACRVDEPADGPLTRGPAADEVVTFDGRAGGAAGARRLDAGPTPDAAATGGRVDARPLEGDTGSPGGPPPAATPDYAKVFPAGEVKRLDVVVAPADWQRMQADMTDMFGKFGGGGLSLPVEGLSFTPRQPVFVPASVVLEGATWKHVGLRFRGNATLASTWRAGKAKMPLGLDFDELEDSVPAARNQRLHGVKSIALMNGWGDSSFLREKVAGDLMREAGVPCGRTAFYRVYVDRGAGAEYLGVYTAVEVPAKPLLAQRFGNDDGNLYKPDGDGAKLAAFHAPSFEKKTNESLGDFRDVQALISAVNAPRKDAATWRAGLDETLDTDGFLRWLAANALVQNWDTYGVIAHNYYLYGDPALGGRLRWIAWDLGNAYTSGFWLWSPRALDQKDVGADWPLTRRMMDDAVYETAYYVHVRTMLAGPFAPASLEARIERERALIEPHVAAEREDTRLFSPADFAKGAAQVVKNAKARAAAAQKLLDSR